MAYHRAVAWMLTLACLAVGASFSLARADILVTPIWLNVEGLPGKQAEFRVTNSSDKDTPIEVTATRISMDIDGTITETPEDDVLIVFPPQRVIKARESQVFRVQYIGEPVGVGVSYYLSIKQLPVELPDAPGGETAVNVQLLYNFKILTNVFPPGGSVTLSVIDAKVAKGKDGKNHPVLTFRNTGTQQGLVRELKISLNQRSSAGGAVTWQKVLEPEDVAKLLGVGLVLPGADRRIELGIDVPSAGGVLDVEINYPGGANR